jgi:hypothetical protein
VKRLRKKLHRKKKGKYPFTIDACPSSHKSQFPTHTHGLAKLGMPEFMMDPFAFGPYGNAARINATYDYFSKAENVDKLAAILNGETVKLTIKDLKPDSTGDEPYTYCFRAVSADFEGVKLAYPNGNNLVDNIANAHIIQIYVEGDTYALTDEYYKGGVTW